ncbi:MAG: right-handed parallel beta-helix repeat-containing protein, partial [Cyclobacteriaceae bacterium]
MKNWIYIVFVFVAHLGAAQTTLYSEDFENATFDNKGQDGATFDVAGVTNWSIDMSGSSMSSGDHFKQMPAGFFESYDTDATSGNPVDWFSTVINIVGYSNVSISVDLSRNSSHSSSGMIAYYEIDGGGWVNFGSLTGSGGNNTATISGLAGSNIQVRVAHWGWSSTPSYRHDNVLVTGISTCAPTMQAVMGAVSNLNSQHLDLNWTAGDGDRTLIVASQTALTANPSSGNTYNADSFYGNGDVIGNGYVVFDGPSTTTTTTVTGLLRNTSYVFTVFTYNSSGNCYLEPGDDVTQTTANLPIAYYVDDNSNTNDVYTVNSIAGDDSNNGKKDTPFATLSKAFSSVIAGDTIYVDAGTYTGSLNKDL